MTNLPEEVDKQTQMQKSMQYWFTPDSQGIEDVSPGKKMLHCALKVGSKNRGTWLAKDLWWGTPHSEFSLYFLGYSSSNSGVQFEDIKKQFEESFNAQKNAIAPPPPANQLWDLVEWVSGTPQAPTRQEKNYMPGFDYECPSPYALALSSNPEYRAVIEKMVQKRMGKICRLLPDSMAFGLREDIPKYVDIARDFPKYSTDSAFRKACDDELKTYAKILQTYVGWDKKIPECEGSIPDVPPMEMNQFGKKLPIDKCDEPTAQEMQNWFLSKKYISEDMPPDEIGDDWRYILNMM
jgi:hypothetical protein